MTLSKWIGESTPEFLSGGNIDSINNLIISTGVHGLNILGLVEPMVETLLYEIVKHPRRKFSFLPKEKLIPILIRVLQGDKDALYDAHIERGIYYRMFAIAESYAYRVSKHDKMVALRSIRAAQYYAKQFRERLIQRYAKLAAKQANYDVKHTGLTVSYEDVLSNYLLAVSKAIDRYESHNGALSNFVAQWITASRADSSHEYGVAYTTPKGYSSEKEINLSHSLEAALDIPAQVSEHTSLASVVMRVDPSGTLALLYNINLKDLGYTPTT